MTQVDDSKRHREERRRRVLEERAARLSRALEDAHARRTAFSVVEVEVGSQRLGIQVRATREILPLPKIARLPHLPQWTLGLTQVRGEVVTAVDLRALIGAPGESRLEYLVVVETARGPLGLVVGAVHGFRDVHDDELAADYVRGADASSREASVGRLAGDALVAVTKDMLGIFDASRLVDSDRIVVRG